MLLWMEQWIEVILQPCRVDERVNKKNTVRIKTVARYSARYEIGFVVPDVQAGCLFRFLCKRSREVLPAGPHDSYRFVDFPNCTRCKRSFERCAIHPTVIIV